ncbi:TetR/AcrR family transcriptional regulator [Zavarzinia sp. CC-PAN008]|uniref:TetR/AcrR family transcriptional regulator n=1 Tax=Zavarzinia sp. CC-PAN008 TaxID=3243332 RepID=UPI003F7460D9
MRNTTRSRTGAQPLGLRESKKLAKQIAIYDAAMTLFASRPYAEVTLEQICEQAGVSRATFFRLFGTKAGLIEEFNRRSAQRIQEKVREAKVTGVKALAITANVIAEHWTDNADVMKEMSREYMHHLEQLYDMGGPKIEATRSGGQVLAELAIRYILEGQAKGEIGRHLDPIFVGIGFMNSLGTTFQFWMAQGNGDLTDLRSKVEQITGIFVAGMMAKGTVKA